MFKVAGPVVIFTESDDAALRSALTEAGAEVVRLPAVEPGAVLAALLERGVRERCLVEGGGEVHASFAAAGTYDAVEVDAAPLLLGGRSAPTPLGGGGFARLGEAPRLEQIETVRQGEDVILRACAPGG